MPALTPYLISEFATGTNSYLEPWTRPKDAWEPLQNAYVYRGTINKRNGYSVFGNRLADHNPVMGIIQRIDETSGDIKLVAVSTTNAYLYNTGTKAFDPITAISNSNFWVGSATGTINVTSFWTNFTAGTVTVTATYPTGGPTTITADGAGNFNSSGIFAAGGTVNHTTGALHLVFTGTTANVSLTIAGTATNYFTGNNTNFFNWVNWQPTDPNTSALSTSYLYLTNNKDPITLYDGTSLSRPIFYVNTAHTDWITKALDVNVYKQSLLVFRPTLNSSGSQALNQAIYASAPNSPFDMAVDQPGHGSVKVAPTGDLFIAEEILRDAVICFFSNSTWIYRFTGLASDPFRIDRISINKRNNSPYGCVAYDERCTSIGTTGFIACDGANVQRYDIPIIDYYETEMSEQYLAQCYSQRYDNLSQSWILYVSNNGGTTNPVVGTGAPGSDRALVYNHLENTWATYIWSTPMQTLGTYFLQSGTTWANLAQSWEDTDQQWDSYGSQKGSPILLMGDTAGNIYRADDTANVTDNGTNFIVNMTSNRWNPIADSGQKIQCAYMDFYYSVASVDPDDPITLDLSFYVDNSVSTATQKVLTLDGKAPNEYYWKRIYCNVIGQFVRLQITHGTGSGFKILGINLWISPSGRFTP